MIHCHYILTAQLGDRLQSVRAGVSVFLLVLLRSKAALRKAKVAAVCRTEEQQAVGPVEEPVAEVSAGQHSVGTGQL